MQTPQYPVNFPGITGMIKTWRTIQFAGAAAEMRNGARPAALPECVHQRPRIMAVAGALKPMEQRQKWFSGFAVDEINIDKIAVRRIPAFAAESYVGFPDPECRINGLQMSAGKPGW